MAITSELKSGRIAKESAKSERTVAKSTKLSAWMEDLESARYVVLVAAILIQGCLVIPAVLFTIQHISTAMQDIAIGFLTLSSFAVVVSNISLASMKAIVYILLSAIAGSILLIGYHLMFL